MVQGLFFGYHKNGFEGEHSFESFKFDASANLRFFFPNLTYCADIKQGVRNSIVSRSGLTGRLFDRVNNMDIQSVKSSLDCAPVFDYSVYSDVVSKKKAVLLSELDYKDAIFRSDYASKYANSDIADEAFLYRTFNPYAFLNSH